MTSPANSAAPARAVHAPVRCAISLHTEYSVAVHAAISNRNTPKKLFSVMHAASMWMR